MLKTTDKVEIKDKHLFLPGEVATKMLYTKSKPTPAKFKSTRHIPSVADKILDAPEIVDDYCKFPFLKDFIYRFVLSDTQVYVVDGTNASKEMYEIKRFLAYFDKFWVS